MMQQTAGSIFPSRSKVQTVTYCDSINNSTYVPRMSPHRTITGSPLREHDIVKINENTSPTNIDPFFQRSRINPPSSSFNKSSIKYHMRMEYPFSFLQFKIPKIRICKSSVKLTRMDPRINRVLKDAEQQFMQQRQLEREVADQREQMEYESAIQGEAQRYRDPQEIIKERQRLINLKLKQLYTNNIISNSDVISKYHKLLKCFYLVRARESWS